MLFENKFTIYSKDNCPQCIAAKSLLTMNHLQYDEIRLVNFNPTANQMLLETFKNLNPHVRSVPYITYGNRVIGGFNELSKVINEQLSNVNKTQILNEGNTNAF